MFPSFFFFFFLAYSVEEQKNLTDCPGGALFHQEGPDYSACQFPVSLLQECSGVNDSNFGYSKGQPCVLVKMNRVRTCFTSAVRVSVSHVHTCRSCCWALCPWRC